MIIKPTWDLSKYIWFLWDPKNYQGKNYQVYYMLSDEQYGLEVKLTSLGSQ